MPRYENPLSPPEVNANVSKASVAGEFFKLAAALAAFCVVLVVVVTFGVRLLAPHLPFRYEVSLTESWSKKFDGEASLPARQYLQKLTEALAAHMALPGDMPLTVHLSDTGAANAFATIGGHIIITQGLLDLVDSENALAMVIAHEIGHIKHRDPITAVGSGVIVAIVMGMLFGNSDLTIISGTSGLLTQRSFSRAQEDAADRAALAALVEHYGHSNGAETFLRKMEERHRNDHAAPEFLNNHPDVPKRLSHIEADHAHQLGAALTPLPDYLMKQMHEIVH